MLSSSMLGTITSRPVLRLSHVEKTSGQSVALVFSTSAFGAVDASPPTELPGCELVGTVKNVKIWAGECEPIVRNGVPVGSNAVPVGPPPSQPGRDSKN